MKEKTEEAGNFNLENYIETPHDNMNTSKTETAEATELTIKSDTSVSADNRGETSEPETIKPAKKPMTSKQRKVGLQEYQERFLGVPKIIDRKTVFVSNELRERIVEVVLRLGSEKSSVSGFVENLVKAHLADYEDDISVWKKL